MLEGVRARAGAVTREIDRAIAVLALIAFISQVGVSIMLPLLPLYAVQVGATPGQLALMVGAFSVTSTIGQLGSGAMASWIPARRQMPLGQAVYATGNFLIATATAAMPVIAFRAMSGLGGGLTIIAERLYIARVTERARLAFTNGVVSAAGSSGSVLGPLLGAVLAVNDLRVPFIVVGCTATVAAVAVFAFLPPERMPEGDEAQPLTDGAPDSATPAGRRSSAWPLVRLALWSVCFNAGYGAWVTTFAPYATSQLGLTASHVVLFFGAFGLGSIVIGPILARAADRSGRRRMIAVGSVFVLANLLVLVAAGPIPLIYASASLAGGGMSAAQSSWFALLGVATDGGRRGRSFGLVSALSNLGVIGGAAAASIVWSSVGLREALLTNAAFLVLATASLLLVPRDRPAALDPVGAPA